MKHPILFYARKNLWKNKKTTAATLLCMLLFVVCGSMAGLLLHSYTVSNEAAYFDMYGHYDGVLKNVSQEQQDRLSADPDVAWVGFADAYGYQPIPDIVDDDFVVVGTLEETARERASLRLLAGNWPASGEELVLERTAASKLRLDQPVGARITLELQPFSGEEPVRREYRIVGVCEDYAQFQGDYGIAPMPSIRLPNALTGDVADMIPIRHALVAPQPGRDVLSVLTPYIQQGNNPYYIHPAMGGAGLAAEGDGYLTALLAVLSAAVIFAGVFSVAANLAITYQGKKEQLLLLKQSGADNGDLIRFVLAQNLFCGSCALLVGIPLSLLLAHLVAAEVLQRYIPGFVLSLSVPWLLGISLLLLALLLLGGALPFAAVLSRRPMESSGKTGPAHTGPAAGGAHPALERRPLLLWGVRSALCHTEKAVSAILSLAFFTAALLGGLLLSRSAQDTMQQQAFCDYTITQYDGSFVTQLEIPMQPGYGILQRDVEELEALPGVSQCTAMKTLRANILINRTKVSSSFLKQYPIANLEVHVMDPREFQKEKEQFGYSDDDQLFPSDLYGVPGGFLQSLAPFVAEGAIAPGDPDAIILVTSQANDTYQVGDSITFTQQIRLHPEDTADLQTKRFEFTGRVAAIVRLTQTNTPLYKMIQYQPFAAFVDEGVFDRHQVTVHNRTVWLDLKENGDDEQTQTALARLRERYPNCEVLSQRQEAEQQRTAILSVRMICAVICGVLGCFGAFSVYNTVTQLIMDQRHTRGILRAIGLERGQAVRGQFWELALWIIIAWLIGLVLSMAFSLLLEDMALQISWRAAVAVLAGQLLLGFLAAGAAIRRLYRKSVSDLLSRME